MRFSLPRIGRNAASAVRRIHVRLRERLGFSFRPDLGDDFFYSSLDCGIDLLAEAVEAFLRGRAELAQQLVIRHFRQRSGPKFFIDINSVPDAIRFIQQNHPEWRRRTLEHVGAIVLNGVPVFGQRSRPLASNRFWKELPRGPGADDLYPVRLHRFPFGPQLAIASHYEPEFLAVLDSVLARWETSAGRDPWPFLSNLTVISRLIALTWTFGMVAAISEQEPELVSSVCCRLLRIIHADADYLSRAEHRSAPNNHRLMYGFAALFVGAVFPEFRDVRQWVSARSRLWRDEIEYQTFADGGGIEPALHYQRFACETGLAYLLLETRNGRRLDPWLKERVERMTRFQVTMAGPTCRPMRLGDSSEHVLFPLDVSDDWGCGALREMYRAIYDATLSPAPNSDPSVERAFWLLGAEGLRSRSTSVRRFPGRLSSFPDTGIYVLGDSDSATRLVFRTGPPPLSRLFAGHMHSDLQSIYIDVDGVPIVVPSGTYTYRSATDGWSDGTPPWRRHFMGPSSSNSLRIGQLDPLGDPQGDFRDREVPVRVEVRMARSEGGVVWVEAETHSDTCYNGHRRGVLDVRGEYWLVYDLLPPQTKDNKRTVGFQLAASAEMQRRGSSVGVSVCGRKLDLAWSDGAWIDDIEVGRYEPPGGWISPRYGELIPAPLLRFGVAHSSHAVAWLLVPNGSGALNGESIRAKVHGSVLGFRIETRDATDVLLLHPDRGSGPACWGFTFDGTLLWTRSRGREVVAVEAWDTSFARQENPDRLIIGK